MTNQNQWIRRTAAVLMACGLIASLLPGFAAAQDMSTQAARRGSAGAIVPLDGPVLVGQPVTFTLNGNPSNPRWDLGDGARADGASVTHSYQKPGIYRVVMGSKVGNTFNELSSAIVRAHTPETLHLPQVLLDTDAANEIDDQHAIAYAMFSELDVLAITSSGWIKWANADQTRLTHSWDSEERSYREILNVLDLAQQSGLPDERVPMVFRGAKQPLRSLGLTSDRWFDTELVITEASNAILAAARGASPDNPVWVLPVGPCTNIATALLQVRQQGWEPEFRKRIRICWLGGGPDGASTHANGGRDAWAPWVTYMGTIESGVEFVMFLERPTGFSINFDPDTDVALYPNTPLGDYLKRRTLGYITNPNRVPPGTFKGMYDLGVVTDSLGGTITRSRSDRQPFVRLSRTVVVVEAGPPVIGRLALQERHETGPLHVVGDGLSGDLENGLGQVEHRGEGGRAAGRLGHAGPPHQQRRGFHFYEPDMDYWTLIDRERDPHELKNVYNDAEYAEARRSLHAELTRLREESGDEPSGRNPGNLVS